MTMFKALSLQQSAMFFDNLQWNGKRQEPRKREICPWKIFFPIIWRRSRSSWLSFFSQHWNQARK